MVIDSGLAALVAAVIGAIVAIVSLVVSFRTERERVRIEKRLSMVQEIEQEKRELLYTQLSEFYDPIFTLLSVNGNIHKRIGPGSDFRWDDSYPEDEVAKVWNELVEAVIVPNNRRICEIVETKLSLISPSDDITPYLEFTTHAYAYQVFRRQPYEAYRLFQFPAGFPAHVQTQRVKLRDQITKLLNRSQLTMEV
jgi:hypothetical protein